MTKEEQDKRCCETCRFWVRLNGKGQYLMGECRKIPPVPHVDSRPEILGKQNTGLSTFNVLPNTYANFWCGAHEPFDAPVIVHTCEWGEPRGKDPAYQFCKMCERTREVVE